MNFKPASVTVGIRTEPVGVRAQMVMNKCVAPVLASREYFTEQQIIGVSIEKIKGKDFKIYKFYFTVRASDHDVSEQEAEEFLRRTIVRWLDD